MTQTKEELCSIDHSSLGEVNIVMGDDKHVSFLRNVLEDGEIHSSTPRGDRDNKEITLDLEAAERVLEIDDPTNLPNVEPVEYGWQTYACYLCGEADEEVLRYKAKEGMFAMSFHYPCLKEFARASINIINEKNDVLVANQI